MSLPKQMKDMIYKLLQEPTLEKLREFLQGETGEHNSIDFKKEWLPAAQLAKEILAIANSQGGIIVFGVSENADKSLNPEGLPKLKDNADISKELKRYLSSNLKYEVFNFSYNGSEYEALAGKNFQILTIEDTPEFIPFMSNRESDNVIKTNIIYIRRGTSCEAANQDEIQALIKRRINHTHPQSGKPLTLDEHLNQLQILYSAIKKESVTVFPEFGKSLAKLFGELAVEWSEMQRTVTPNPLYPDEEYDEFVSRMIAAKKNKIERFLDLY